MNALERIGERFSAILVKEVRQALRGRSFQIVFWFTLFLALVLVLFAAARMTGFNEDMGLGRVVFDPIFVSLAIACHGLVPFAAFQSMGGEWDEGTFDLLILSNLGPRQIVFGKFWSASTQAMLVYAALLPFLGFAFLCGGIDILAVLTVLGVSAILTLSSIAFALGVSSLARGRVARMFWGVVLLACLTGSTTASGYAGSFLVGEPEFLRTADFPLIAGLALLFQLSIASISLGIATARLSHAEENRSTSIRILAFVIVALGIVTAGLVNLVTPGTSRFLTPVIAFLVSAFLYVNAIFIATEPDALPRRVRSRVSTNRGLALLSIPLLPGGGRGVLYLTILSAATLAGIAWAEWIMTLTSSRSVNVTAALFTALGYIFVMCAMPGVFLSPRVKDPQLRGVARIALVGVHLLLLLAPMLIGILTGNRDFLKLQHFLNPLWVYSQVESNGDDALILLFAVGLLVAILFNLPRMILGIREVLDASRDRRLRESRESVKDHVATRS